MHIEAMQNEKGIKSANNFVVTLNNGNRFLQSYGEIVAMVVNGVTYVKKEGLGRSLTTKKYIERFADKEKIINKRVLIEVDFNDLLTIYG